MSSWNGTTGKLLQSPWFHGHPTNNSYENSLLHTQTPTQIQYRKISGRRIQRCVCTVYTNMVSLLYQKVNNKTYTTGTHNLRRSKRLKSFGTVEIALLFSRKSHKPHMHWHNTYTDTRRGHIQRPYS